MSFLGKYKVIDVMNYSSRGNDSFEYLDEILKQNNVKPLSLNPDKNLSTSFAELGDLIVRTNDDFQFIEIFRSTLEGILQSVLDNFPENIFWDSDFLVGSMLRQALVAEKGYDYFLKSFQEKIESLMNVFGNKSEIRFRYLHDFTYGYDWVKWVEKQPQIRSSSEPFNLIFLDSLHGRGQEILQRINIGDCKYPRLPKNLYRNPFSFPREPKNEKYLFPGLAREKLIPIAAWDWNAFPAWNKPFHQIRESYALSLVS